MRWLHVVAFLLLSTLLCASFGGNLFAQQNSPVKQEKSPPKQERSFPISRPPLEISVMEAILSALENNPSLKAQRYAPALRETYEEEEWGASDPTLSAGFSFSLPLGNRAADARSRRAALSRAQMEEAVGNLERAIEVEIRTAFTDVKRARATVFATSETRRLQEEKL